MREIPMAAALVLALSTVSPAQDWTNYGGNAARNGQSSVGGPTSENLDWSDTSYYSIISWFPFIHDGRVFVIRESGFPQDGGAANDTLVAYDLASGTELWNHTLSFGGDTSTEWIAWIGGANDGKVYASRSSHQKPQPIKAFDAVTGAPLWISTATSEAWAHDGLVFAPDGDLILGDFQSVMRIEESDGTTVWTMTRNCPVSGNCGVAATATAFYIDEPAPGGNEIGKYDLATGNHLYSSPVMPGFTTQNAPFLSPDGQTVYFSRTQNNVSVDFLYAFHDDGTQMTQLWSQPVRWTTSHEHGIGLDGSIYTFTQANEFVRLDPATGNITANAGVLSPIGTSNLSPKTAVDAHGNVYVSNGWASNPASDGRLWAFNADLSQNLFTLQLDRQNAGGPALGGDGRLVMADRAGVYTYAPLDPGTAFGGGSAGFPCPCGNNNDGTLFPDLSGCASSPNPEGARLLATGTPSVSADDVVLVADHVKTNAWGLFFKGDDQLLPGVPMGGANANGLLQCATKIKRFGPLQADGTGYVDSSAYASDLHTQSSATAGDTRHYQWWYRTPKKAGPCSNPSSGGSNTSNGYSVTWTP